MRSLFFSRYTSRVLGESGPRRQQTEGPNFLFFCFKTQPKPPGLKEVKTPFLYGILFKRTELSPAMFTPSRLLLRLGYDMRSKCIRM